MPPRTWTRFCSSIQVRNGIKSLISFNSFKFFFSILQSTINPTSLKPTKTSWKPSVAKALVAFVALIRQMAMTTPSAILQGMTQTMTMIIRQLSRTGIKSILEVSTFLMFVCDYHTCITDVYQSLVLIFNYF